MASISIPIEGKECRESLFVKWTDLKGRLSKKDWQEEVNLYDPQTGLYYGFGFGDGLGNEVSEGCDDYVYCRIGHQLGADEDGGQLDFLRRESGYDGDIWKALPDAFVFLDMSAAQIERLEYVPNNAFNKICNL